MQNNSFRPPRPRLTGRIAAYALADVFGLTCLALGASWFATGKGAIIEGFPASTAEAVACTGGGLLVMFWAVTRILRELAQQAPEMQARHARWMSERHPDRLPPDDQAD